MKLLDASGSSFKFLPEIGYQLLPNAAVGVSFGYIKGYAHLITGYNRL